ncbi:uncharacterized protein K02A2.6-like isoform X1 [Leguminivora glycinivorella]|nr:uncharacterized protein K02A2.6-like isoform X1 [Leguminivora glycinivorella]
MGADIEQMVQRCELCQRHRAAQPREPLCPHPVPSLPWQVVAADLFEFQQKHYLLVVDYYSKFIEVASLNSLTSGTIINQLKNFFGRFGIPQKVVSDNGPQFSAQEFSNFAGHYGFEHVTSSPLYARSNGLVERNVQTVKKLFTKAQEDHTDWQLALLNFRNTPISGEQYSPAQLLMGRRLRTRLPGTDDSLKPETVDHATIKKIRQQKTTKIKEYYDRGTRSLPQLRPDESVRMRDNKVWVPAKVVGVARGDRSYWLTTENGRTYRRNRAQILQRNEDSDEEYEDATPKSPVPRSPQGEREPGGSGIVTRSGRQVRPPQRFSFD